MATSDKSSRGKQLDHSTVVPSEFEIGCLIAVRLCIAAFALMAATAYAAYFKLPQGSSFYSIYTPIAWLFGVSLLSAVWLAWRKTSLIFTLAQFLADSLLVIAAIWITGQIHSPLLFLLIPIVAGAGLLAGKLVAVGITLFSALLYGGLLWAVNARVLPLLQGSYQDYLNSWPANYFYLLAGLLLTLLATAFGADYIRRLAFAGHHLASKSQQDLLELERSNQALVNNLSEGIVTTDLDDFITFINQAALQLFQIEPSGGQAIRFSSVLKQIFPNLPADFHKHNKNGRLELFGRHTFGDLHISLNFKQVINTSGETTGWIYILQDVSQIREMESQLEWQNKLVQAEAEIDPLDQNSALVSDFVGQTTVMQKIFRIIAKVAPADANVLIAGESGTGKELVARSLHKGSLRSSRSFVAVNCGAIPENLIESQFFGHKRGSFTGADHDHRGLFVEADGGTIFLDEIGELPLAVQAKLLRVIQEKVVRPVGGERDIPVNVRIISATNRHLKAEVEAGRFREDLYYRLNVISINMPPLRDRKDDLPLLINSLLKRHTVSEKLPTITPASLHLLMQHDYPGNIRELENILERALVLGGEIILPEHLPEALQRPSAMNVTSPRAETKIVVDDQITLPLELDRLLNKVERKYIEVALLQSKGVKKDAAALLGMNFRSFRYRLQKYNIDSSD